MGYALWLMKSTYIHVVKGLLLAGLLASSGCFTVLDPGANRATQEREDVLILREDNRRLAGRVESLELQIEQLHQNQDRLQDNQRRLVSEMDQQVEGRMARVEQQIAAVDAARVKDRGDIVEKLSTKITQVMASSSSATHAGRSSHSGTGYEHTVGAGQTLSEIAKAYGVSISVIIRENNLKNPDQLRLGQTLFIPE